MPVADLMGGVGAAVFLRDVLGWRPEGIAAKMNRFNIKTSLSARRADTLPTRAA